MMYLRRVFITIMMLGCLLPALVGCTQETTIYKAASLDWDVHLTQAKDTESFTLDMKYHGSEQHIQEVSFRLTSPEFERSDSISDLNSSHYAAHYEYRIKGLKQLQEPIRIRLEWDHQQETLTLEKALRE
ncbi:hypothetical protein PAALTS15_10664 [Paenibacillus alvei TS-15]|uniref:Lipoprotein n=1 Tax=Paenibacillus alvei TS-15 TaxID=1117108 RepID=S9TYE9_PAEAL|nr:hypothetical protein [Paenibacillus alvei]EPY07251.1 hypothetical protein PAALTS15_10664 [Paenibacillus alvei TS-15]